MEKCGIAMTWGEVCVFNILTYNFFNSSHRDRDCMLKIDSNRVKDHVFGSNILPLIRWLTSFQQLFGESTALPLPTTCCWMLLDASSKWTHMQYFVLLDVGLAYDISSDLLQ